MIKQKDQSEKVRGKEKESPDSRNNANTKDRQSADRQHRSSDKMHLKQMPGEVLSKARSTFSNISDAWRPRIGTSKTKDKTSRHDNAHKSTKHLKTQDDSSINKNTQRLRGLSRQFSADPLTSSGLDDREDPFSRVKVLEAEDITALQRPRKKLSFREPEIIGGNRSYNGTLPRRKTPCIVRTSSLDELDLEQRMELESQAMRVVRSVGQAFEVCHKLDNEAPKSETEFQEADYSFTEDRIQNDNTPELTESDKEQEENPISPDETTKLKPIQPKPDNRPKRLELPTYTSLRRSPLPKCDQPKAASSIQTNQDKPTTVAAQHEIQLLREKLEQQCQQTQHAMSQLLLVREQLATEAAARVEAQNRTQQLLMQNRELLDHIAALISHLQNVERNDVLYTSTPPRSPALNVPQPTVMTPSLLSSYSSLIDANLLNTVEQLRNSTIQSQPTSNTSPNIYSSPLVNNRNVPLQEPNQSEENSPYIRPLSQVGTLTTVDNDGRFRVIIPVSGNVNENQSSPGMVSLRLTDEGGLERSLPANNSATLGVHSIPGLDRRGWSRHSTK